MPRWFGSIVFFDELCKVILLKFRKLNLRVDKGVKGRYRFAPGEINAKCIAKLSAFISIYLLLSPFISIDSTCES